MLNKMRTGLISAFFLAAIGSASAATLMPYLGLVAGQTAKAFVANPLTGFSCQVQIELVDTNGTPVATGQKVTLGPGQSTSLTLSGDAIAAGGRTEIRPIVDVIPTGPCRASALASAEVVDTTTGAVRVFYPTGPLMGSPEKIVRFALIDLAQGQIARIIAVNLDQAGSTELRLRFLDGQGNTLIEQTTAVAAGASAALDFALPAPPSAAVASGGSHLHNLHPGRGEYRQPRFPRNAISCGRRDL